MSVSRLSMLQRAAITKALREQSDRAVETHPLFSQLKRENELGVAAIKAIHGQKILGGNPVAMNAAGYLGRHVLAEFKIDPEGVFHQVIANAAHPEKIILDILIGGANAAKATILGHHSGQTQAEDIWAIVVIQESHFSLHYRKQENFIAVDAFTCGEIDLEASIEYIQDKIKTFAYDTIEFKRGVYQNQDERFLKGVAALCDDVDTLHFFKPKFIQSALGQHVIAEFYVCDVDRVNSVDLVLRAFHEGLDEAGAIAADRFTFVHKFSPQGVSAVVCGEDFHLTIHDWPEHGYAAIDLCVFGNKIHLDAVMKKLISLFQSEQVSQQVIPRGAYRFDKKLLKPVFNEYLCAAKSADMRLKL